MTEERARQVANVVMAAAALGAAVLVFRSPRLRRIAWQAARQYASGPLAAWTAATVRDAWDASAQGASGSAGIPPARAAATPPARPDVARSPAS